MTTRQALKDAETLETNLREDYDTATMLENKAITLYKNAEQGTCRVALLAECKRLAILSEAAYVLMYETQKFVDVIKTIDRKEFFEKYLQTLRGQSGTAAVLENKTL